MDYPDVDAPPASGRVHLVFADHLGCPEPIEDLQGNIVWAAAISPYGSITVHIGASHHQPLRWPGHYHDAETDLHYNRYRTYAPQLGRYLEPDPIGRGGGFENVYIYTSNPLNSVDVDGLAPCDQKVRRSARRKGKKKRPGKEQLRHADGKFKRGPKARKQRFSRKNLYPSGYSDDTHNAMAIKFTKEGQAHLAAHTASPKTIPRPPPVRSNRGRGEPMNRPDMHWTDDKGRPIPYYTKKTSTEKPSPTLPTTTTPR